MLCPTCDSEMVLLLFSSVCPTCTAPASAGELHRGYVVWRSRPSGSHEYVFESIADAETWRRAAGLGKFPIRSVLSHQAYDFRTATGTVPNLRVGTHLFAILHNPAPASNVRTAWLEPVESEAV